MSDIVTYIQDINASMMVNTSWPVKIWMVWMSFIFLASLIFIRRYGPARLVFAAMLATFASVLYIWSLTKNIHLFGVAHVLIWLPLIGFLWGAVLSKSGRQKYEHDQKFQLWIFLLVTTIAISLIFDVRDIHMVMLGKK